MSRNIEGDRYFQQQEVLKNAPYTRNAFNFESVASNAINSEEQFNLANERLNIEIASHLGSDWRKNTVKPLAILLNHIGFFSQGEEKKEWQIERLIKAGFELGRENIGLFHGDIVSRLFHGGVLNQERMASEGTATSIRSINGLLAFGARIRTLNEEEKYDVFKDFINGIDENSIQ